VNKLISFEGVDGCGKSTQLKRVADWLTAQGQDVVTTFEPGDTTLGAEIRRLLLASEFVPVPEAELLLFLADRAQHVQQLIRPALERGAWVLCDRYSDSTLAYQLAARKLGQGAANLKEMLAFAECGVSPALTLWFDVPVSEALKRMQKRVEAGEKSTRLDNEAVFFHQRVAAAFSEQYQNNPERIKRIDANLAMDEVERQVKAVLIRHFQSLSA
jgi:dTMP kinase